MVDVKVCVIRKKESVARSECVGHNETSYGVVYIGTYTYYKVDLIVYALSAGRRKVDYYYDKTYSVFCFVVQYNYNGIKQRFDRRRTRYFNNNNYIFTLIIVCYKYDL